MIRFPDILFKCGFKEDVHLLSLTPDLVHPPPMVIVHRCGC